MNKQVVTLLVLITIGWAACPANYNINNLQAVTFALGNNASQNTQNYKYQFAASFASAPAVALALHDFALNYVGAQSFAVAPASVGTDSVNFQFDFSSAVWSRVRVNFWASSNPEIQVGNFRVDSLATDAKCNCALVYANTLAAVPRTSNPVIRIFLNGFDVTSASLQLSVSPTNFEGTKITAKLTLGPKTTLRRAWLSFLVFSPSTATSFSSYGGQLVQSKYSGSTSSDISSTLYQTPFVLYGLTLLSLSGKDALSFSASIDNSFVLTVAASRQVDDFGLVYVAAGVTPCKICTACGSGLVANGAECVAACPAGTYSFTYRDGGVACRSCSSKLGQILSGNKCVAGVTTTSSTTTTTTVTAQVPKVPTADVKVTVPTTNTISSVVSNPTPVPISTTISNITVPAANPTTYTPPTPTPIPIVSTPTTNNYVAPVTPTVPVNPTPVVVNPSPVVVNPTPVVVNPTPVVVNPTPVVPKAPTSKSDCPANAYFNGDECVCEVGYVFISGKCQLPNIAVSIPIIITYPGFKKACNNTQTDAPTGSSTASNSGSTPSTPAVVPTTPTTPSTPSTPSTPAVVPAVPANSGSSSGPSAPSVVIEANPCGNENEIWNGTACVCASGFTRVNKVCKANDPTPAAPVENVGVRTQNGSTPAKPVTPTPAKPVTPTPDSPTPDSPNPKPDTPTPAKPSSITCGPNSFDNGLGVCVCNSGFYFAAGLCVSGAACGANSVKTPDGRCACAPGFTNYNGVCSKCPPGALWSSSANKCIWVCGQNAAYSAPAAACVCNAGFGLLNNVCQQCPLNHFISNGYCVTCPVNSAYNAATRNCDCQSGFFTNQFGICTRKCGTNEVYDPSIQNCNCIKGLGRINGACQVCPAGSTPAADGSGCSNCRANEVLINGQCVCQPGYAYNSASGRTCTLCANIPNGFIINGICSVCPGNTVYDGVSTCRCPAGKIAQGSRCISQCQADELLDNNGNCYTCGANQVISGGKCVCANGYTFNDCGVCTLSCANNQFSFRGACAVCPLNTVYNAAINGCACPSGFYMDTYGVCQKLVIVPIACPDGQYFDSTNGCQACSASCKTCKSANSCTTCATRGYLANAAGVCVPNCGDGLIVGSEGCDTGNTFSVGCSNCQITSGWTCSGQPSVCQNNLPTPAPAAPVISNNNTAPVIGGPTAPVAPNAPSTGDNTLSQVGKTNINSNNVFITLKTTPTFTFANPTEMQSFIQATFPSGRKPTVYCAQRNSPALDTFDCLLIYPSGVPNAAFKINFSYNYQGKSGATTVTVDPLTASNSRGRPAA